MPQVSIGMPAYSHPEFFEAALERLVGQTFNDWELLISDNASPDPRVREICERYAARDDRVRYVRQQTNIGATGNFFFVLDHTSAPYFMWAADDDLWEPTFVARGVAAMESDPSKSAWFCQYERIDRGGNTIRTYPPLTRIASRGNKRWEVLRLLMRPEAFGGANLFYSLFRRGALAEPIEFFRANMDMAGVTLAFVYAFVCRHDIVIDPKVLFHKRFLAPRRPRHPNPFAGHHFAGFSRAAAGTPYAAMTRALLPWRFAFHIIYKVGWTLRRMPVYLKRLAN